MKHKIINKFQTLLDEYKNGFILINLYSFDNSINLRKIMNVLIQKYKKIFSGLSINHFTKPSDIKVSLNDNLTKITNIIITNYGQLICLELYSSYRKTQKFYEVVISEIKDTLKNNNINADINIGMGECQNRYKSLFTDLSSGDSLSDNRPLKKKIFDILWLNFGIDDKLTEKEINQIVKTAEKIKPKIVNKKIDFEPPLSTSEIHNMIKS